MLNGPPRPALALVLASIGLAAAPTAVDEAGNLARLRALPIERRRALAEELGRFDALDAAERDALLKLDDQLAGLPPEERARDLALLRRYHLWSQDRTEEQRRALADASTPTRVARIRQIRDDERQAPGAARRDDPVWTLSPSFNPLSFSEEAFQIRVWPKLSIKDREILVNLPGGELPRMALMNQLDLARKHPGDYRDVLPNGGALRFRIYAQLAGNRPGEALRLLAQVRDHQDRAFRKTPPPAVELSELNRFEATFPPWIRERIVALPPDAARWRLMILHDLAYNAPVVTTGPRPRLGADRAGSPPTPTPKPTKPARPPETPRPETTQPKGKA